LFVLAAAAAGCATGCATGEPKATEKPQPQERVYFGTFEEVGLALKQAMIKYPPKIDNSDAGIFETDFIKGDARFRPPSNESLLPSGYRYRLLMRLVRGRSDEKAAVKVIVTKQAEIALDFFSDPKQLGSDGLEEEVVLYRIQREIAIARAIRRAQDRFNRQAPKS
jgi:hypothetical protein